MGSLARRCAGVGASLRDRRRTDCVELSVIEDMVVVGMPSTRGSMRSRFFVGSEVGLYAPVGRTSELGKKASSATHITVLARKLTYSR